MIPRTADRRQVAGLLGRAPVVAILGARQVGKSTLARQSIAKGYDRVTVFDLERSDDLAALADPLRTLESLRGLVIIDEVQRRPDLFPTLRVLADRRPLRARFLVLGSASPELLRQSSESLAGRIAYHELGGLSLEEVGARNLDRLWLRGGFPRSYLARSAAHSAEWRENFIRTYLERDVPELGIRIPSGTLRRFWSMLAHWHGQVWNASEFGRSFGVSDHTVRRYLDILTQTYVVRQLLPWHENIAKRQVKSPRVYVTDSGLLHALLGVDSMDALTRHPKVGASWEGFAMATIVHHLGADARECFFWRAHTGAELDLLVVRGRRRWGFEFKLTSAPAATPSTRAALEHLKLDRLDMVHAGRRTFPLGERIRAVALTRLLEDLAPLDRAAATRAARTAPGRGR
ncbi:MAG: ATP-binding protein [Candidatus Eisenbacteria bacterium]|uniref:ATP-binding protein n=1 Tax=Eiseniibacteriota bacterium TaxID=2212470 RepID=A0A538U7Z0_UNCEI|nr:MAG: ATP-binding protein [Candidatus Eisenbacteria bacterium]